MDRRPRRKSSRFEADTVNAWLAAHELPLDDKVYQYGRTNLRNELRAYLLASIVAIIQKPACRRTPREQAVYQWMQANVKKLDVQLYQAAIAEWNAYKRTNATTSWMRTSPATTASTMTRNRSAMIQSSLSDRSAFHAHPRRVTFWLSA